MVQDWQIEEGWSSWEIEHYYHNDFDGKSISFLEDYVRRHKMPNNFATWRSMWRVYIGQALPHIYEKMYDYASNADELLELLNACPNYIGRGEFNFDNLKQFEDDSQNLVVLDDDLFTNGDTVKLEKLTVCSIKRLLKGLPKLERITTKVSSDSLELVEALKYLSDLDIPLDTRDITAGMMLGSSIVGTLHLVYGVDFYSENIFNKNMKDNKYIFSILQSLEILSNITLSVESQIAELKKIKRNARLALSLEGREINKTTRNSNVDLSQDLQLKRVEFNELKCKQRQIASSIKKIEKALSSKAGVFEQMDINNLLAKIKKFQTQLESPKTTAEMKEQINAKIAKLQKKLTAKQQELNEILALQQQSNLAQLEILKQENNLLIKKMSHLEETIKVLHKQISIAY